jgi:hypothetical protein
LICTLLYKTVKLNTKFIAVEVVLSLGGNQRLDISGGAAMMVTPDIPLRIEQI